MEIRLPVHVQWHNKERQNREQRHQDVGLERRLPQQSDLINARGLFVVVASSERFRGIFNLKLASRALWVVSGTGDFIV